MGKLLKTEIINSERINDNIYRMVIHSPYLSEVSKPGQFLNILCCDGIETTLRRPISILKCDAEKKQVEFLFQVKGKGTEMLALRKKGELLDVMGPLGNHFWMAADEECQPADNITPAENIAADRFHSIAKARQNLAEGKSIALVGGGIGIFPLLFLAERYRSMGRSGMPGSYGAKSEVLALLGFRNGGAVLLKEEFEALADQLYISTDDGSTGIKGPVTVVLEEALKNNKIGLIYACGPVPMLKAAAALAEKFDVPCQLSLEQRMGCGVGACLVCACKTRKGSSQWQYSHVCKDGPVFWSSEVIWDE